MSVHLRCLCFSIPFSFLQHNSISICPFECARVPARQSTQRYFAVLFYDKIPLRTILRSTVMAAGGYRG